MVNRHVEGLRLHPTAVRFFAARRMFAAIWMGAMLIATLQPLAAEPNAAAADVTSSDAVVLQGRITDTAARPIRGATVAIANLLPERVFGKSLVKKETVTQKDGTFRLEVDLAEFTWPIGSDQFRAAILGSTTISASAPGFGVAWIQYRNVRAGEPIELVLRPELPVVGLVVDLEGQPQAGAVIRIRNVLAANEEGFKAVLQSYRQGAAPWGPINEFDSIPADLANLPEVIQADDKGRFKISGIAGEHLLELEVRGSQVAVQDVLVATKKMDLMTHPKAAMFGLFGTLHGNTPRITARASRLIRGVVRDQATQQPIAGVSVQSFSFAGTRSLGDRRLQTETDADGRFEISGMPKGRGNKLLIVPADDQPYFLQEVPVDDSPGFKPIELTVEMEKGIRIRGQVTDKSTSEPVAYAIIHYFPYLDNRHAQDHPAFTDLRGPTVGYQDRYTSDADGKFSIVGLPGRAIVGAVCGHTTYRMGVGAKEIEGMGENGTFPTFGVPVMPGRGWPQAMAAIEPAEDALEHEVNIELDPGSSIRITTVDPDGNEMKDYTVDGMASSAMPARPVRRATFEVVNLTEDETRTIVIQHKGRSLGKVLTLSAEDVGNGNMTVKLLPQATVSGQVVDRDGEPIAGLSITPLLVSDSRFEKQLAVTVSDSTGRFRFSAPSGAAYSLQNDRNGMVLQETAPIQPNTEYDLGTIKLE